MNAKTPSNQVRAVALIAALLVTAALFDGVASLTGFDSKDNPMQKGTTVVAQSETTVAR
jgi:hypothetical protein